ncbi:MAG: hypothetical protein V7784_11040 [Oceanospirillaceae bacterium]
MQLSRNKFLWCDVTLWLSILSGSALLSGCATTGGNAEFLVYQDAFKTTDSVAQSVLDRMAVSERVLLKMQNSDETLMNIEFKPENAQYYVTDAEPPITRSLRNSFKLVSTYGEALAALASGESANLMASRVSKLASLAAKAMSTSPANIFLEPLSSSVQVIDPVSAFEPLIAFAYTQRTRQEFQQRLLADYQNIDAVLVSMHRSTPQIFDVMKTQYRQTAEMAGGDREDEAVLNDIKQLRALMSHLVLLINHSRLALTQAKTAIESPNPRGFLGGILSSAQELEAVAQGVRNNLLKLN